ncbi:hypothetical protein GCM10009854_29440 [Saccharopolyspora halophila]|uniref:Uncharacterized protein n=1 Tax=Saccharopolyspora halophila TaxID=405551 RepID=A0ABN3GEG2_9PSEU
MNRESGANPELTRSGVGDGGARGHWGSEIVADRSPGKAFRPEDPESEDLLAPGSIRVCHGNRAPRAEP